jgi:hypothetical protein
MNGLHQRGELAISSADYGAMQSGDYAGKLRRARGKISKLITKK